MIEAIRASHERRLRRQRPLHERSFASIEHLLARVHVLTSGVASLLEGLIYRGNDANLQLIIENIKS